MKCIKCGTMSESGNATCPSCLEPVHVNKSSDGNSGMPDGGCGCGHSH